MKTKKLKILIKLITIWNIWPQILMYLQTNYQ